ncbi:MAG: tetratricopeptide repeat protein [Candidatus Eisenbacteria bacterium]
MRTLRGEWRSASAWLVAILLMSGLTLTDAGVAGADDLKDARAALQAGRLDEAQGLFERTAGQGSVEGRIGVGQVLLKRRQYPKASEAFQQAQKMDPSVAWGFYGEGEVLKRRGDCAGAIPLLRKATDLDRKFPDAQMALGECLVAAKQVEGALTVLAQGTKWGPKWRPKFLVALGNAELARDSLRSASVYFTQAREESPQDPAPRKALGDFYLNTRRIAELAIPEYTGAVELDTSDVELRFALAQALYAGQRYNEALEQYRRVVASDPGYAPGQMGLGNLYYLSGAADPTRYADARAPLEKYTQLEPEDPKGWSLLGRTYFYLKLRDEASTAMEKSVALGGGNKETFTIMGRMYGEKKEWQKAIDNFERGEPTTRDQLTMGQMYVFMGRHDRADSIYKAIVARDPRSSDARFAINEAGKMRFRQQDYEAAITTFREVIALDPKLDEAYYYIGLAHKEKKRYREALDSLRQAALLAPAKADRQFWLGILYAQLDSTALARESFRKSVALDSAGSFAGVAFRQLGFYELLDKNYDSAIRNLERAVALNDKDVQAWVWLGQGNQNSGRSARAIECYRKALALDPRQADALRGLRDLGASAPR